MRTIYFNTHGLALANFEILKPDNFGDIEVLIRSFNGHLIGVGKVERVTRKGYTVSTHFLNGIKIEFHIGYADYHALQTDNAGYHAYIEKREKESEEVFKRWMN